MNSLVKKTIILGSITAVTAGIGVAVLVPMVSKKYKITLYNPNVDIETNKNASHYFVIMMDSMASYKMESVITQEHLESEFNGWDLKMNVLSPGYGTETGLSGVIGGPKRTPIIGQFKGIKTPQTFNNAWDNMVADVSTADVEHIYISNPEYYNSHGRKFNGTKTIKDPMNKVKYLESSAQENEKPDSLSMLVHQVNANENNFSFFVSDVGHTNGYSNAYYNKNGGGIVNQILNLKKELKRRNMYDTSYILVVSDHGRAPVQEKDYHGKYMKQLRKMKYNYYVKYNPSSPSIDSITTPTFKQPETRTFSQAIIGSGEAVTSSMASIFYKPRYQRNNKIRYDEDNLFADYDAPGIFYNDLNIDDKNLAFNMNKYMPKTYAGSSYNSYVKNPLKANLSKRKLFVMNKNNNYGIYPDLHFGKQISLYKGPFLKPGAKVEKYILDKMIYWREETPFLEKQANNALKTSNIGGLKILGEMLYSLESTKKLRS